MQTHLKLKEKLSYGFGDLASVLYWQTFMLYLTFFYTDVFLLPAGIAATMFLVSRVIDAVNDPMMGIIADRTNTKWGKFRPYLLWFAIPFAIVGVFTFTVPDYDVTGKIIWAYSTFIMIMVLYTIINIPYTSLLGVISPNSNERTSVSSIKFIFAFAAGIIISATLLPLTQYLGNGDDSITPTEIVENTLTLKEAKKGLSSYSVSATDSHGNTTTNNFSVTVVSAKNNTPEVVKSIENVDLTHENNQKIISLQELFKGNVSSDFEYAVEVPSGSAIKAEISNKNLQISIPESTPYGSTLLKVKAIDEDWGEVASSFYVNVKDQNVVAPQIIDTISEYTYTKGFGTTNIDLTKIFKGAENCDLTYSVSNNNTAVLKTILDKTTLTIKELKTGISDVTIVVDDKKGGRIERTLTFNIINQENNAPIARPVDGITLIEGFSEHQIDLSQMFYDIEGDALQYKYEIVNEAKGWSRFFMIIGGLSVIFFFIAFKGTKERVQPPVAQKTTIKKDLKQLFTNKPWLILLATTITFILFVAVRGSVTVHYFKYFIAEQTVNIPFFGEETYDFTVLASAYNTIGQLSSLLGVFLVGILAKMWGKRKVFNVFFAIAIFSTAIVFFLKPEQLSLIFFFQITGSFTGGPLSVLLWAMYADIADYAEWKNGTRATGLIFSASTMSQKFGWAFGGFVALTLMSQVGFEPNQIQTEESTQGLLSLFTIIPAAIGVVSIIILLLYPLNDTRVKEIEDELTIRRQNAGEAVLES